MQLGRKGKSFTPQVSGGMVTKGSWFFKCENPRPKCNFGEAIQNRIFCLQNLRHLKQEVLGKKSMKWIQMAVLCDSFWVKR